MGIFTRSAIEKLAAEHTYHIYNRAHGNEKMFRNEDNYQYFLRQFVKYVNPVADTFAYCLMPNHFHFLIRIKTAGEIGWAIPALRRKNKTGFSDERENLSGFYASPSNKTIAQVMSLQFSKLFNSYTKALMFSI